ncbi:MAG: rod shape-determining protein MreC [Terriglobales bacterium]
MRTSRSKLDYRHHSHAVWILGALVAGQLLLLGYQVRRPNAGGIRRIRLWSAEAILPAEAFSQHVVSGLRSWTSNFSSLRHTQAENRQLHSQLVQLELQNQQLRQAVRDLPRLDALLGFQHTYHLATVSAQVISHGASPDAQAIYLDRGSSQGLRRDMAVITPQGLVGKLGEVLPSASQVLLITDPESGVGVLIGPQGIHGIVRGLGAGRIEAESVLKDEPVKPGDPVFTSGEDQVFPKGLPVGTVLSAGPSHDGIFKSVAIQPAANLGRLQAVLVVTAPLPVPAESQDQGLTAADVRQQHLPGLPVPAAGIGPILVGQQIAIPSPPPVLPMPKAAEGQPKPPASAHPAKSGPG